MVSGRSFPPNIDTIPRESRRLIGSFTSLPVNPGKVNESIMVAPEKAARNSLRSKPPSSWNPIQNNLHP